MHVLEIDSADHRRAGQFLALPFWLYRDVPTWVPPLRSEARQQLDQRKNPFFQHSTAGFFLALDSGDRPAGRLAVLDHRNYNAHNREQTAFFYLFECVDDPATAQALFEAAFAWSRRRGLDRMIGPKGFSVLDGMGLLVEGFQYRPALGIPYNLPYYPALLEAIGFTGMGDILSGYLSAATPFPEKFHQLASLIQERRGLRVAQFRRRNDLRQLLPHLQEMYNASIADTSGNAPITVEEVHALANQLLWFADPQLIKLIMKGDRIVGFLFAYPDISAALQRQRGRLFPFGWLDALIEMRRTPWVNINGAGILQEYRGLGGTALLFSEMEKSIRARGFQHAELVQIGAENDRMLRELRSLGVNFYKRHRLYQREL